MSHKSLATSLEPADPEAAAQHPLPPHIEHQNRPANVRHISAPTYRSPDHHRQRRYNPRKHVKETLDAKSEYSNSQDDGTAEHRINQYSIKQEIGRGSYGSVHLATDQFGREVAIKEFSKSRLRKRAQSNMLRRTHGGHPRRTASSPLGFNLPLQRQAMSLDASATNSLDLIRQEIAIMKKLDHPNLVSLIEVLDDPHEDLLYMVLEMCKKGVVMHVGLEEQAEPYDNERCRLWFRDMILGLEYLHAQGIIHRDIKPDNCLITEDDVLKIVDFGVSEMFENSHMNTSKSAGSPAFMPPELCVAKHGEVSGRAVDIWSTGATLYCLAFGRIPFEKVSILDLYEAIKNDEVRFPEDCNPDLKHLLVRLLEKDPTKRIEMDEIRDHPWVTRNGTDMLLSKDENIVSLVDFPTQEEVNKAITAPILKMVTVMKAASKFKRLLNRKRPQFTSSIVGEPNLLSEPPEEIDTTMIRSQSDNLANRKAVESQLVSDGITRDIEVDAMLHAIHGKYSQDDIKNLAKGLVTSPISERPLRAQTFPSHAQSGGGGTPTGYKQSRSESGKGQAHDPLEDSLFLNIGSSSENPELPPGSPPVVSESPSVVEDNVYEKAYEQEVQRILKAKAEGRSPTIYLTKRVEKIAHLRDHKDITDFSRSQSLGGVPKLGFAAIADLAKKHVEAQRKEPKAQDDAGPSSSQDTGK